MDRFSCVVNNCLNTHLESAVDVQDKTLDISIIENEKWYMG